MIAVKNVCRKRGFGVLLLKEVTDIAGKNGMQAIALDVHNKILLHKIFIVGMGLYM